MKYIVSVAVDGRIDIEVEAKNFKEAKEEAEKEMCFVELERMECIDMFPVNATDENGNIEDYI